VSFVRAPAGGSTVEGRRTRQTSSGSIARYTHHPAVGIVAAVESAKSGDVLKRGQAWRKVNQYVLRRVLPLCQPRMVRCRAPSNAMRNCRKQENRKKGHRKVQTAEKVRERTRRNQWFR